MTIVKKGDKSKHPITKTLMKAGFNSSHQVSQLLGKKANGRPQVDYKTLQRWHDTKPTLFAAIIDGLNAQK